MLSCWILLLFASHRHPLHRRRVVPLFLSDSINLLIPNIPQSHIQSGAAKKFANLASHFYFVFLKLINFHFIFALVSRPAPAHFSCFRHFSMEILRRKVPACVCFCCFSSPLIEFNQIDMTLSNSCTHQHRWGWIEKDNREWLLEGDPTAAAASKRLFINLINYKLRDKSELHLNEHDVPNISLSSVRPTRLTDLQRLKGWHGGWRWPRESDVSE